MILTLENVHTYYGLSQALFGISLEVEAGECVCLLGRNGVGKSTTMRSIMGLTPPASGRVLWKGQPIAGWRPDRVARAGIGFVPEDRRVFGELTVLENLDVARRAAGRPGALDGATRCAPSSPCWSSCAIAAPACSRAASSRCSPSRAR